MRLRSNIEDLRKRGMLEQADITFFLKEDDEVLYRMVNSPMATKRSAAVHILAERYQNYIRFVTVILERLCKEKSLYTKLEICSALEQGNIETARQMVNYLGVIGNNRHKELPDRVSKKVSYPLPRDIIARTLSNMSPTVFGVMLEVLEGNDTSRISEVIDAIGFMVFYNNKLATAKHAQYIYDVMEKYWHNQVILWKSVLCLSAFPLESSVRVLERIKITYPDTLLSDEASRSLKLIEGRVRC